MGIPTVGLKIHVDVEWDREVYPLYISCNFHSLLYNVHMLRANPYTTALMRL